MTKTLLLAFSMIAVAACGDDAPPEDDRQPEEPAPGDASRPMDGGRGDAAPGMLDAALEAGPGSTEPDATTPTELPDASVVDAASFDAQVVEDAGRDAAAMCVAEGEDCQVGACCDGTACVTSTAAPYPACLATCDADSECESGCCTALSGGAKVCAAASYCETEDGTAPLTGVNCFGSKPNVYGRNDVFMGVATYSFSQTDGVCRTGGDYARNGSKGPFWPSNGAFGASTFGAPEIRCKESDFWPLAYISKAQSSSDGTRVIDPDNLCEVLRNSNL